MDIVEELLADELPDDRQSDREARIILCDMHRRAADEIEWLREALKDKEELIQYIESQLTAALQK